jgi:hypothetical protein
MSTWNCRMPLQIHYMGCHCIVVILQAAAAKSLSQQYDCHCKASYIATAKWLWLRLQKECRLTLQVTVFGHCKMAQLVAASSKRLQIAMANHCGSQWHGTTRLKESAGQRIAAHHATQKIKCLSLAAKHCRLPWHMTVCSLSRPLHSGQRHPTQKAQVC